MEGELALHSLRLSIKTTTEEEEEERKRGGGKQSKSGSGEEGQSMKLTTQENNFASQ